MVYIYIKQTHVKHMVGLHWAAPVVLQAAGHVEVRVVVADLEVIKTAVQVKF